MPFEEGYNHGHEHYTGLENIYYLNGNIYQTRDKFGKTRDVVRNSYHLCINL